MCLYLTKIQTNSSGISNWWVHKRTKVVWDSWSKCLYLSHIETILCDNLISNWFGQRLMKAPYFIRNSLIMVKPIKNIKLRYFLLIYVKRYISRHCIRKKERSCSFKKIILQQPPLSMLNKSSQILNSQKNELNFTYR